MRDRSQVIEKLARIIPSALALHDVCAEKQVSGAFDGVFQQNLFPLSSRTKLHPDDLMHSEQTAADRRTLVLLDDKSVQRSADRRRRGLSYVRLDSGKRFLLKDAVESAGDLLLGADVMRARSADWNILCKFFDNLGPIPSSHAPNRQVAPKPSASGGKPEAYYFPPQYKA